MCKLSTSVWGVLCPRTLKCTVIPQEPLWASDLLFPTEVPEEVFLSFTIKMVRQRAVWDLTTSVHTGHALGCKCTGSLSDATSVCHTDLL